MPCVLSRTLLLGLVLGAGAADVAARQGPEAAPREPALAQEPPGARDRAQNHPAVRVVQEYRRAVALRDTAALRRLQSPHARVWFESREGEGRPLDPAGKGPWAAWDTFFRSRAQALEFFVEGQVVRVTNRETNDWYRLVEREPAPYSIFYYLDAASRIEGKLIQRIPGIESPPDRLHEFEAWAAKSHPGLLEELMPAGRIDPSLEKARVWKARLLEWRAEMGLPDVLEP